MLVQVTPPATGEPAADLLPYPGPPPGAADPVARRIGTQEGVTISIDLGDDLLPKAQQLIRDRALPPDHPFEPFPAAAVEQSLTARFEAQARRFPGRVALASPRMTLTYAELDARANRIARGIRDRCGEGEGGVALLFDHDAVVISAMLGALKAGTYYVALDPAYPRPRLEQTLRDSEVGLVLTDGRNLALARALAGPLQVVDVEALDGSDQALPSRSGPGDDFALLLYTSGSTGAPKGIVQSHRNVLHDTMHYTNRGRLTHEDRFLLISSVSFAASLRTIYTALLNGASLHPFDVNTEGFPRLAQWMREQAITIYRSVPTVFRYFVSTLTGDDQFPALRLLYLGGEPVSRTDVELYRRHFGRGCVLVNRLGSTETLTYRSSFIDHDTPIPEGPVPVGYAVPGKEVLIVDADGRPVPPGEAGEIVVRSRYLSPGFWRQPERTRAAFAVDPADPDVRRYRTGDLGRLDADGCLFHLGRIDFEVKIRGHRVETPGVETALRAVDGVREAVVVAQRRGQHDGLVAYIVPTSPPGPDVSTLRRVLAEQLPDYMVPATYVALDALPLLPSGKVDRRALPEPSTGRPELAVSFVAPRNELEAALAAIWSEVLGLDAIGVHDEFLDLGGDSLSAGRIIARVTDQFEATRFDLLLWEASTVALMAAVLTRDARRDEPEPRDDP